ncbi:bifunctional UDP-sugar hydrolase/5'-nucleotidase [Bacillus sp. 03113]|uniref:bifunctional metallophosphatase/5'-nucleotidase n=1 Tax=Bacillus sp. 03113 TaxID=2578211 RepID=UPI00215C9F6F|nr:bifunctional UDP-sugar hydrolase/5'-nucleotidase [Bacillus sp. 03113]
MNFIDDITSAIGLKEGEGMETIHIYHTNDLHSHFENWPRINELLTKRKKWHEEAGDSVFIFDIGDHMDLWHPYTEATQGKNNTELLNEAHYTAATIGNNEGITLSYTSLDVLYKQAKFDVIVANLYRKDNSRPEWAKPYQIYQTNSGLKIAVIGLTVFYSQLYDLLGWKLTDPFEELNAQLKLLKNEADIIVLLSHLGIHDDEMIAEKFPDIDVILGAHTHHILHEGKLVNHTLLAAAGKYGYYTGHVTLEVDSTQKKITSQRALLYDTNHLPIANDENQTIENLYHKGKELLSNEVVRLTERYSIESLAQLLCTAMVDWCKADCGFLNEGLILNSLEAGSVSHYDLLKICPHPINPCVVALSGAELKEVLNDTCDEKWAHLQVKGLGFRGTIMGKMVYEGIEVNMDEVRPVFSIRGNELLSKQIYRVAIPDMFSFGRYFPAIYRAEHKEYFLPEFMRYLLEITLKKIVKS